MGSKASRAVQPQVKAAVSPGATSENHDVDNANARRERQDLTSQLPGGFCFDDSAVATSTITRTTTQRRNSAPAPISIITVVSTDMEQARERGLNLAPYSLTSLQQGDSEPEPAPTPAPVPQPVPKQDSHPAQEKVQCVICLTTLPDFKDAIRPCKMCETAYCASCIKHMFIGACTDVTRMPPQCCNQLPIHYAKPFLSKEELDEYRTKYDEWQTPNPFYCPIPTCSTFIPNRLLPKRPTTNGKRIDSGAATPISKAFACPKCEASICLDCRQAAHPDSMCIISDFGIDAETTKLLKSWGYKKCPKCGHGLKRMFGCNHMECHCGAHFCYACMEDYNRCGGGCRNDEAEYYDDTEDEIEDPDEREDEPQAAATVQTQQDQDENGSVPTEVHPTDTLANMTPPQPIVQPLNLDGGGQRYWERQEGLFFGDEPRDGYQHRSWACDHEFSTYPISLEKALVDDPESTDMECVKCWCPVHPEIVRPKVSSKTQARTVPAGAGGTTRNIQRGTQGGRGRARTRAGYMPARGLFRTDATVGTAPHLTAAVTSPLSQSAPDTSPMEDLCYAGRVVDTYGNTVVTTELDFHRRGSTGSFVTPDKPASFGKHSSTVFASPTPSFSFAYDCPHCDLIVCASCRDEILATQEAKQREKESEDESEDDETS